MLKIKAFLLLILGSLIFTSTALAGGSRIAVFADSDGWANDSGFGRIIRVYLNHDFYPCIGTSVTFKFAQPKDGDSITTAGNSATYIMQEDKTANGCSTYAKMTSKDRGERSVEVEVKHEVKNGETLERSIGDTGSIKVDFDGEYHADNHLNGFGYRGSTNDPYSYVTPKQEYPMLPTNLRITQVEITRDPMVKNVHFMWDPVAGATSYNFYTNRKVQPALEANVDTNLYEMKAPADQSFEVWVSSKKGELESKYSMKQSVYFASDNSKRGPSKLSASLNVRLLNQEFIGHLTRLVTVKWDAFDGHPGTFTIYVKSATNKNDWEEKFDGSKGPSATVNLKSDQDYHLKVYGCMDKVGTCVDSNILFLPKLQEEGGKVIIPQNPDPTISSSSEDNTQVEQLNQKVQNLQNQLDDSKKSQSLLEARLNSLVSWIKSIFPFFK